METSDDATLRLPWPFRGPLLAIAGGNTAGGDQIKQIGYGIAAGVLMDTILVPSFVAILGHWNWWPSSLFRSGITEDREVTRVDAVA